MSPPVRIRRWAEMDRWDWVLRADLSSHVTRHALAPIGSFLRRRRDTINRKKVAFADLVPISIHFDGSISRREMKVGREYTLEMQRAHPGDVVLSKIDLKNAAVGLLPDDWSDVAVTTHFAVYEPDKLKVHPFFFRLLVQSPQVKEWLASNKSGADGRKEVKLQDFEDLEIPLPTPDEQRALVEKYESALAAATALEQQAAATERLGLQTFEAALGLTPPPDLPRRPFQIARFRDLDRWSHEGILQRVARVSALAQQAASSEDAVSLGDYVEVTHGCSASPSPAATALQVLKISAVTRGSFRPAECKFAFDTPEVRERFSLRAGDVLMCRVNGTLRYVGMSALVTESLPDMIFPDKLIRVRIVREGLLPEFLWRVLQSPTMRAQIESVTRTAVGNYAIGSADVRDLEIILPKPADQIALMETLLDSRADAARQRAEAQALRARAWQEFLAAVFS